LINVGHRCAVLKVYGACMHTHKARADKFSRPRTLYHTSCMDTLERKLQPSAINLAIFFAGFKWVFCYRQLGKERLTFEVFKVLIMKNAVFLDVTPCGSCKNRRFGGTYGLHHQRETNRRSPNNVFYAACDAFL
jgi:hypothetical protein